MYQINDALNMLHHKELHAGKLLDINAKEILSIGLKANAVFPKHTSPTDVHLIMLEGSILFYINNKEYRLLKHQIFNFPKNVEHWVTAIENSKFIIIR